MRKVSKQELRDKIYTDFITYVLEEAPTADYVNYLTQDVVEELSTRARHCLQIGLGNRLPHIDPRGVWPDIYTIHAIPEAGKHTVLEIKAWVEKHGGTLNEPMGRCMPVWITRSSYADSK